VLKVTHVGSALEIRPQNDWSSDLLPTRRASASGAHGVLIPTKRKYRDRMGWSRSTHASCFLVTGGEEKTLGTFRMRTDILASLMQLAYISDVIVRT